MILTIKEAAKLLEKLARYTPEEQVELKFLEGLPVQPQPKKPNNILFAQVEIPPMQDEKFYRRPFEASTVQPPERYDPRAVRNPPQPWYYN